MSQLNSEKEATPETPGPDLDKVAYSLSFELGNALFIRWIGGYLTTLN